MGVIMAIQQTPATAPAAPDDVQAVRQLSQNWITAVTAKDIDRLVTLVTDDVIFLPPNGRPIQGKEAVRDLYLQLFAQFDVAQSATNEEIQVTGDWAFSWGSESLVLRPRDGGAAVTLEGKGLTILRRQSDGSWQFARGINNSSPQSG
jgi:uncharacterized protein (TIGR02246 family)